MKKFTMTLSWCLLAMATSLPAVTVTLKWDPNPESNIAGYRLYYGNASRSYTSVIDVGNVTEFAVTGIEESTYFAVTAYNTEALESDFSNEAFWEDNRQTYFLTMFDQTWEVKSLTDVCRLSIRRVLRQRELIVTAHFGGKDFSVSVLPDKPIELFSAQVVPK